MRRGAYRAATVLAASPASKGLALRSFKLRFDEPYAWVVPSHDASGCLFTGPGVTLRGDDARGAQALAAPLRVLLDCFEPGVSAGLRTVSLALDEGHERLLCTFEGDTPGFSRPRVLRVDRSSLALLESVLESVRPLRVFLGEFAARDLAARGPA